MIRRWKAGYRIEGWWLLNGSYQPIQTQQDNKWRKFITRRGAQAYLGRVKREAWRRSVEVETEIIDLKHLTN